jgi:hypothetical protein
MYVRRPPTAAPADRPSVLISKFKPKHTKMTAASLAKEMSFDLILVRISLVIDILSHSLVALAPATPVLFTLFSVVSGFGSGVVPALQSLALCIVQRDEARAGVAAGAGGGKGQVFGAMASVQAIGQQIVGPVVFGVLYANTVASFPKAIFTAAAGILVVALALVFMVRPPPPPAAGRADAAQAQASVAASAKAKGKRRQPREMERGRSRATKDLRTAGSPEGVYGSLGSSVGVGGTPASVDEGAGAVASGSGSGSGSR